MSAFSGQFDWNAGLIWQVGFVSGTTLTEDVGVPGAHHLCPALVDTGASRTCIAKSVIEAINLHPIGRTSMANAGGTADANVYDVHIALLTDPAQNPDGTVGVQARLFRNLRVLEFVPDGNTPYQALIGRDILRIGMLTTSRDGHFSFAF